MHEAMVERLNGKILTGLVGNLHQGNYEGTWKNPYVPFDNPYWVLIADYGKIERWKL